MSDTRVPGHALMREGRPFTAAGKAIELWDQTTKRGYAMCECGVLSPYELVNNSARKGWHRLHKDDVRREVQP